jgi:glycosyltransferase involved in cell wall biosynthesis
MKIALIAPIEETVPPQKYGGTEWIVYHLAHGLGKKGHTIDLYTTGDSPKEDYYNIIPTIEKSIRTDPIIGQNSRLRETHKLLAYSRMIHLLQKNNYDLIHNHAGWRFLLFSPSFQIPILTTHHGPLSIPYENIVFKNYKDYPYISISHNQRRDLSALNYAATIYNGINIDDYSFYSHAEQNAPMFFLARMSHEKGAITAAQVAHKLQHTLLVAAKVDTADIEYFQQFKPYIDDKHVTFYPEIGLKQKIELLQKARCLLLPIQWEEPFGLMFTEAMACGTPVITYSRGSAPEIVVDGITGFLVNQSEEYIRGDFIIKKTGIEGLREAVEKIYSMPDEDYRKMRKSCREHVEKNFTVERMVDEYEKVYEKMLKNKVK